jgi:hypothetical protein
MEAAQAGHVVELDPFEPQSVPVKRNALGRLGARDVAAALAADGRAVVFMADGREAGLLWRFVSEGPAQEPNALDQGTLYAARFEGGALRWIALPSDAEPYSAAVARGANSLGRPVALAMGPDGARLWLALREIPRNPAGAVVEILFAARNPAGDTAIVENLMEGRVPPRPRAEGGKLRPSPPGRPHRPASPMMGRGICWLAQISHNAIAPCPMRFTCCHWKVPRAVSHASPMPCPSVRRLGAFLPYWVAPPGSPAWHIPAPAWARNSPHHAAAGRISARASHRAAAWWR